MLNSHVRGENMVNIPAAATRVMIAVRRWFGWSRRSRTYRAPRMATAIVARKMRSPKNPKAWHRPYNSSSASQLRANQGFPWP